ETERVADLMKGRVGAIGRGEWPAEIHGALERIANAEDIAADIRPRAVLRAEADAHRSVLGRIDPLEADADAQLRPRFEGLVDCGEIGSAALPGSRNRIAALEAVIADR